MLPGAREAKAKCSSKGVVGPGFEEAFESNSRVASSGSSGNVIMRVKVSYLIRDGEV